MSNELETMLRGELLDDEVELTLADLCRACAVPADEVFELVEQGLVEPRGREPTGWRFEAISVRRVRCAVRLQRDLGVNRAGAALALELLEEMEALRRRLRELEG